MIASSDNAAQAAREWCRALPVFQPARPPAGDAILGLDVRVRMGIVLVELERRRHVEQLATVASP